MHYTVYLDLLFLVNFTVDLWILLLEQKLLRFSASGFRLALGAAFGSGWVCFLVLVPLPLSLIHISQAHLKKAGTPTMGGLAFLASVIVTSLIFVGKYPQIGRAHV